MKFDLLPRDIHLIITYNRGVTTFDSFELFGYSSLKNNITFQLTFFSIFKPIFTYLYLYLYYIYIPRYILVYIPSIYLYYIYYIPIPILELGACNIQSQILKTKRYFIYYIMVWFSNNRVASPEVCGRCLYLRVSYVQ